MATRAIFTVVGGRIQGSVTLKLRRLEVSGDTNFREFISDVMVYDSKLGMVGADKPEAFFANILQLGHPPYNGVELVD